MLSPNNKPNPHRGRFKQLVDNYKTKLNNVIKELEQKLEQGDTEHLRRIFLIGMRTWGPTARNRLTEFLNTRTDLKLTAEQKLQLQQIDSYSLEKAICVSFLLCPDIKKQPIKDFLNLSVRTSSISSSLFKKIENHFDALNILLQNPNKTEVAEIVAEHLYESKDQIELRNQPTAIRSYLLLIKLKLKMTLTDVFKNLSEEKLLIHRDRIEPLSGTVLGDIAKKCIQTELEDRKILKEKLEQQATTAANSINNNSNNNNAAVIVEKPATAITASVSKPTTRSESAAFSYNNNSLVLFPLKADADVIKSEKSMVKSSTNVVTKDDSEDGVEMVSMKRST